MRSIAFKERAGRRDEDDQDDDDSELENGQGEVKLIDGAPSIDFMKFKMTAVMESYSVDMKNTI